MTVTLDGILAKLASITDPLSVIERAISRVVRSDAEFVEGDHPRGSDGKFGSGGSSSSSSKSTEAAVPESKKTYASLKNIHGLASDTSKTPAERIAAVKEFAKDYKSQDVNRYLKTVIDHLGSLSKSKDEPAAASTKTEPATEKKTEPVAEKKQSETNEVASKLVGKEGKEFWHQLAPDDDSPAPWLRNGLTSEGLKRQVKLQPKTADKFAQAFNSSTDPQEQLKALDKEKASQLNGMDHIPEYTKLFHDMLTDVVKQEGVADKPADKPAAKEGNDFWQQFASKSDPATPWVKDGLRDAADLKELTELKPKTAAGFEKAFNSSTDPHEQLKAINKEKSSQLKGFDHQPGYTKVFHEILTDIINRELEKTKGSTPSFKTNGERINALMRGKEGWR